MKYTVNVTRTGYAHREIEVEAATEEEAKQKAEEIAGNFEFSEKDADYKAEEAWLTAPAREVRGRQEVGIIFDDVQAFEEPANQEAEPKDEGAAPVVIWSDLRAQAEPTVLQDSTGGLIFRYTPFMHVSRRCCEYRLWAKVGDMYRGYFDEFFKTHQLSPDCVEYTGEPYFANKLA